jgi:hypothetical protein
MTIPTCYPDTRLRFGPGFEVDLRRELTETQRRQLRSLGLGRRFGIVTAFNPRGEEFPVATNRRRLVRLERRLAAAGLAYRPADGLSINRRHCERGFAVAADRRGVVALARAFDQLAVFWFDGSRFLLVWCDRPGRGLPLPTR